MSCAAASSADERAERTASLNCIFIGERERREAREIVRMGKAYKGNEVSSRTIASLMMGADRSEVPMSSLGFTPAARG